MLQRTFERKLEGESGKIMLGKLERDFTLQFARCTPWGIAAGIHVRESLGGEEPKEVYTE